MKNCVTLLTSAMLFLCSCKHEIVQTVKTERLVCFEEEILPIFQSTCAKSSCHNTITRRGGHLLDNYDSIMKSGINPGNALASRIYQVLTDSVRRMPPAPANIRVAPGKIELIKKWIEQGAKNTKNCNADCDTALYSYSGQIWPTIQTNCAGCHSGTFAGGRLDFTTYEGLKAVALNGRLMGSLNHEPGFKPEPRINSKLSDCKINQVKRWVLAGAPNN